MKGISKPKLGFLPEIIKTRKMDMMETVNMSRSVLLCNLFHFCFAAAKASLVPFLTLFCRLMGLSATETGLLIAVKTLTGFIWAPLWSKCAIAYNKRRTVLMFSIFVMSAIYLSLSVVFVQLKNPDGLCVVPDGGHWNMSYLNKTMKPNKPIGHLQNIIGNDSRHLGSTPRLTTEETTKLLTPATSNMTKKTSPLTTIVRKQSTTVQTIINPVVTSGPPTHADDITTKGNQKAVSKEDEKIIILLKKMIAAAGYSIMDLKHNGTSDEVFEVLTKILSGTGLTKESFRKYWPEILSREKESGHTRSKRTRVSRGIKETWNTLTNKMVGWVDAIKKQQMQLFLIILVIIVCGEFLCSPVEKVADDAWFDYLDQVDDLEKYGKQRLSGSIAFALFPVLVTLAVDYTACFLPFKIHHFLIHFYVFGAFMCLTFLLAFFYPVPTLLKHKNKSKVKKGLQIICCDCRGFLYIITLLIMGATYASVHNFLFWVIQDLGGQELNMGLCVTIGACSELPMLMLSGKLVQKLGNNGVVSLSLLAMTVRTLYYSFMTVPWSVLPAEMTHAFTHTAMWYAILSYDDFNVGPSVDRSIRSILSSVYFGVGFSIGSVFSGVLYDLFGSSVVYWAGSAVTGTWAVIFFLISKCLPKKEKIRYIRLPRAEDLEESDADDDWLEMALKEQ